MKSSACVNWSFISHLFAQSADEPGSVNIHQFLYKSIRADETLYPALVHSLTGTLSSTRVAAPLQTTLHVLHSSQDKPTLQYHGTQVDYALREYTETV